MSARGRILAFRTAAVPGGKVGFEETVHVVERVVSGLWALHCMLAQGEEHDGANIAALMADQLRAQVRVLKQLVEQPDAPAG